MGRLGPRTGGAMARLEVRACIVLALLSCDAVRPIESPLTPVTLKRVRAAEPLPEDCDAKFVDPGCAGEPSPLRADCARKLPRETLVASLDVCKWPEIDDDVVRAYACRVGGDTIVRQGGVTDSCLREDFETDRRSGATRWYYAIYRLRR